MPPAHYAALLLGLLALAHHPIHAQSAAQGPTIPRMVSPDIDQPGQPFSYASQSTDQIGVMFSPSGTEITPEGYLYTGFGELIFFTGPDRAPVTQRLRTLEDGHLPVLSYQVEHDGLTYRFTIFAASLGPEQNGQRVVNFLRVAVRNPGSTPKTGFVTTAWRYQGEQKTPFSTGDNRFRRPVQGKRTGDYQQPGELFKPDSTYAVQGNAFLQDGKAIYFFPTTPAPQLTPTLRDYYNRFYNAAEPPSERMKVLPTTPVATAEYALSIPPHGERTLDFKMPLLPIAAGSPEIAEAEAAGFDERHAAVRSFWNAMLARGMTITTPETKVNDTFDTSLVNVLMSLNKIGDDYVQTINQLHYHGFYLRDSADFVRMYDTTGYPDLAGKVLDFFAARQQPDGNFLSQPGQFDGWGEALWTYGEHYRITHDKAFAASVYPRVVHAVDWLDRALAADPLHIMPSTDVRDNEYIPGHLTGYNFLALDGLQAAALLAHDLGHKEDEVRFRALESSLRANFMHQLDAMTARTGGYMPPALDGDMGGADWGNLLSLTPEQQLAPFDPRVTATLRATQARYAEGLMTYNQPGQGIYLHHYLTIKNSLTELIRGEQEQAVRDLYAILVHTSSTHAGWEYSIRPWTDRDFSGNLAPHGWFATEYRNLLRNMMVREEGTTLHLLSALSPAWVGVGKQLRVERANTYFGQLGFTLASSSETEAVLTLSPRFAPGHAPERILLHVPWFMDVHSVTADGKPLQVTNGAVQLPLTAHTVKLTWTRHVVPDLPANYDDAVDRFQREYRARYDNLTGTMP